MPEPAGTLEGAPNADFLSVSSLFARAEQIARKLEERGETVNAVRIFERAAYTMNAEKEELVTLWATLECAALAVRRVANSISMTYPDRP